MFKQLFSAARLQKGALIFLLGAMAAPLAVKFDWWHFTDAFTSLRFLFFFGVAVAGISLLMMCVSLFRHGGAQARPYGLAILIAALPIGMMLHQVSQVKSLPYIHDITTDMETPPAFETALELRQAGDNSAEYAGEEVAAKQRQAYGDIGPVYSPLSQAQALHQMQAALTKLGMNIVSQQPARGHIEATDTTFWFGFVDDVVVRVTDTDNGSRIDIRSASRVGKSDIGKNAQRIRQLIAVFNSLSA